MRIVFHWLIGVFALGLAFPLAADHLLTFAAERKQFNSQLEFFPQKPGRERNLEAGAAYEGRILISKNAVRTDGERDSWIYLRETKKLFRLHHHNQTYEEYDLPIDLRQLQDEKGQEKTDHKIAAARADITVERTDETATVGRWKARKFTLLIDRADEVGDTQVETWQATDLGIDANLYDALRRARIGALPWIKDWENTESDLPGFSVRRREERELQQWRWVRTRELLRIEEVPHDPERFRPPPAYQRR